MERKVSPNFKFHNKNKTSSSFAQTFSFGQTDLAVTLSLTQHTLSHLHT